MFDSSLFRRYWIATSVLVAVLLCAFGATEATLNFREQVERLSARQQQEARMAANDITRALSLLEEHLQEVARLPWNENLLTDEDRQQEFHRILKLFPSVHELKAFDADGRERAFVSRTQADRVGAASGTARVRTVADDPDAPIRYGAVYYRNDSDPFVTLFVREHRAIPNAGTEAELDLRAISRMTSQIRLDSTSGFAFLVDSNNRVIAHPRLSQTLLHPDLSGSEQIRMLRAALAHSSQPISLSTVNGEGQDVRTTAVSLGNPPWLVVIEEPLAEAMRPVWEAVLRTLVLLLTGLIAAFVTSLWLSRRLTRPVLALRDRAVRIGQGDLGARIDNIGNDELGDVAREFNRMAQRVQESHQSLETRVAERTKELAEANERVGMLNSELEARVEELRDKKDEADRANAAKTRFLAAASHDLRQPMHTISLLAGMLRDRTHGDDAPEVVEKIERSVEAMENLFGSLLDISKLDAGVIKPAIADVPVNALLQHLVAHLRPQAAAKGLRLRVVATSAIVRSDAALLERILANLVANAINYTQRGGIVVGCRVSGASVRILVADTGIGIEPSRIADAFEEFVQLDSRGRDRSKGLGLGLSIVKRTADLLGHALVVRSQPGRGSTFGVEVPLAGRARARHRTIDEGQAQDPAFAGSFVALIDDDWDNCLAMDRLCRRWGCITIRASSGAGVLAELQGHLRAPDLIITDFRLGQEATGIEVIAAIREATEMSIPAIVITGDVSVANNIAVPDVMVLHKPLNATNLRRAAYGLLSRHPLPG